MRPPRLRVFLGLLIVIASPTARSAEPIGLAQPAGLAGPAGPADQGPDVATANLVVVEKTVRRLTLFADEVILATYDIALGSQPDGPKRERGDGRTPEGAYVIDTRNPESRFHRSLRISYPNEADRQRAEAAGVAPGGEIYIHGLRNGWGWVGPLHLVSDWTDGCIAVTNEEIEEIWWAVPDGTPIEIHP